MIVAEYEMKYRYQEYLRQAEQDRLCNQLKKSNSHNSILLHLGNALMAVGQHLNKQNQPNPNQSIKHPT